MAAFQQGAVLLEVSRELENFTPETRFRTGNNANVEVAIAPDDVLLPERASEGAPAHPPRGSRRYLSARRGERAQQARRDSGAGQRQAAVAVVSLATASGCSKS